MLRAVVRWHNARTFAIRCACIAAIRDNIHQNVILVQRHRGGNGIFEQVLRWFNRESAVWDVGGIGTNDKVPAWVDNDVGQIDLAINVRRRIDVSGKTQPEGINTDGDVSNVLEFDKLRDIGPRLDVIHFVDHQHMPKHHRPRRSRVKENRTAAIAPSLTRICARDKLVA